MTLLPPKTGRKRSKKARNLQVTVTSVLLATKAIPRRGEQFFNLYKMLLGENAQVKGAKLQRPQLEH